MLEVRSALVPDAFGGNMDTPEMRAGATCYLGVNVEGALLSLGDGHARQGEGETCGVAVECAMNTVLVVDLIKGAACPWPRLESDEYLMSAGSARPLEDAFRIAQLDMVQWLAAEYGFDPLDAYQLITQAIEAPLANVCDPNYTSLAKMPKRYLPGAAAMGGAHARLRELAAPVPGPLARSRKRWTSPASACRAASSAAASGPNGASVTLPRAMLQVPAARPRTSANGRKSAVGRRRCPGCAPSTGSRDTQPCSSGSKAPSRRGGGSPGAVVARAGARSTRPSPCSASSGPMAARPRRASRSGRPAHLARSRSAAGPCPAR